ncbi:dephospho-CoA kinase [Pirellulaceae bacterium SH449]
MRSDVDTTNRIHNSRKVVGIIGGVASGKSVATETLAEFGGRVLNADEIAHQVLTQPEVIDQLVNRFGRQVLENEDEQDLTRRRLDRKRIARLVFGETPEHRSNKDFLESVVQTRVRQQLLRELSEWKQITQDSAFQTHDPKQTFTFLVLDIPLLFERGWDEHCDYILMIDTPEERRRAFAMARGWTESDWRARERNQLPIAEKRSKATHIIANDGSLEQLKVSIKHWCESSVLAIKG